MLGLGDDRVGAWGGRLGHDSDEKSRSQVWGGAYYNECCEGVEGEGVNSSKLLV